MLSVRSLRVDYGHVQALRGVNLEAREGEITAIIGSNGAGKTSTLMAISGLAPVTEGEILFRGAPITGRPAHEITTLGITQILEGRQLFADQSVEDNLLLGAYSARSRAQRAETLRSVYALFPRLAERRTQLAGTLSGGEQQMAAIGRGLMGKPAVLMLDEPSLGLAPILVDEVFRVIAEIAERGVTVLLVEQNVHRALEVAATATVIENGRVVLSKPAREMADDPQVRSAYLGL